MVPPACCLKHCRTIVQQCGFLMLLRLLFCVLTLCCILIYGGAQPLARSCCCPPPTTTVAFFCAQVLGFSDQLVGLLRAASTAAANPSVQQSLHKMCAFQFSSCCCRPPPVQLMCVNRGAPNACTQELLLLLCVIDWCECMWCVEALCGCGPACM